MVPALTAPPLPPPPGGCLLRHLPPTSARSAATAGRPRAALLRGAAAPLRRGQPTGQRLAGAQPAAAPLRAGGRGAGRALVAPCRAGGGGDVPVRFRTQREVKYGEVLRLVGSHPSLGNWKVRLWCAAQRWGRRAAGWLLPVAAGAAGSARRAACHG